MTPNNLLATAREEKWSAQKMLDHLAWRVDARYALPPVPVEMLARHLGIELWESQNLFDRCYYAMCSEREDAHNAPKITFDAHLNREMKRFAIARGIAHIILHEDPPSHVATTFVERYTHGMEANEYAARMLIPGRMLRKLMERATHGELARMFGVTEENLEQRMRKFCVLGKGIDV